MARKAPKLDTIRRLFALSGNQCAYPECEHILINEHGAFVSQICHIEAAEEEGQRYNPDMSDENRRSFENLLLMCYRHHVETNDVEKFTVRTLQGMKNRHEIKFAENEFQISDTQANNIHEQQLSKLSEIELKNKEWLAEFHLAMEVEFFDGPEENLNEIEKNIKGLKLLLDELGDFSSSLKDEIAKFMASLGYDTASYEAVPYCENPFNNPFWEMLNLYSENTFTKTRIQIQILRCRLIYMALLKSPSDKNLIDKLDKENIRLSELASTAGYVD
ncbi:MAG: hypothetical protein ABJG88_00300 [Litorimonas sp.]